MSDEIKPGDPLYERFVEALDRVTAKMALDELVRRFNTATPEEQAQAMVDAGPEGEDWARVFEDVRTGGEW